MIGLAKTIGRIIAVLVDAGIVDRKQAAWILEPYMPVVYMKLRK